MSRSSFVRDDRRKWDAIVRSLPELNGAEVKIGLQADAGVGEDGTPIVEYGFYNEFGTEGGGWGGPIPPRPFIRDTADKNRAQWFRIAESAINSTITRGTPIRRGLEILGTVAQRDIQEGFTSMAWAPNSPVTVALKGSSAPLIATGAMRQAIRYEVKI